MVKLNISKQRMKYIVWGSKVFSSIYIQLEDYIGQNGDTVMNAITHTRDVTAEANE